MADTSGTGVQPADEDLARDRRTLKLSVVAPAYNEQEVLDTFFARLEPVLARCAGDYEIVCVNDGSRDATLAILVGHMKRNPKIKILDFSRNFGKEVALSAGLEACTGGAVIPIDVDLQDPPELIETFVEHWERGFDVVYGVRAQRASDTWLKRVTAEGFYSVFSAISDVSLPRAGDFRLLDRKVVDVLTQLPERNRFMKGLFSWVGFRQVGVPYDRPVRAAGTSAWRYWRLWNFAIDGLTSFTTLPLRIWTYAGGLAAVVALAYAAVIFVRTLLNGGDVPGYPSLMVVMLTGFSVQAIAIGVLGEYVGRIYAEVKQRPLYIIQRRYGFEETAPAVPIAKTALQA